MTKVDKYHLERLLSGESDNIAEDLYYSFAWGPTPQGFNFWANEHWSLINHQPLSHEALMYLTVLSLELENEELLPDHENVIT